MPNKFTKINIDIEVYEMIKTLASAKGISATSMLETIILAYMTINSNKS